METQNVLFTPFEEESHCLIAQKLPSKSDCCLLVNSDISQVAQLYSSWVSEDIYNVLSSSEGLDSHVMSKRGNYFYVQNLCNRVETFTASLSSVSFFNHESKIKEYNLLKKERRLSQFSCKTNALYVVCTVNREHSRWESWNTGADINRFIAGLRKCLFKEPSVTKDGKARFNKDGSIKMRLKKVRISSLRVNESQEDGYWHGNFILLFDTAVEVFPYTNAKGVLTWRVKDRKIRDSIAKIWKLGFVDVQGISNVEGSSTKRFDNACANGSLSMTYLFKYFTKDMDSSANREVYNRTLLQYAMEWSTRSRSFSLSRTFTKLLNNITNSIDLINNNVECITQTNSEVHQFVGSFPSCAKACFLNSGKMPPADCRYLSWYFSEILEYGGQSYAVQTCSDAWHVGDSMPWLEEGYQ